VLSLEKHAATAEREAREHSDRRRIAEVRARAAEQEGELAVARAEEAGKREMERLRSRLAAACR